MISKRLKLADGKELLFDEDKHEYTIEGRIIPSVTQILNATKFKGKLDGIPEEVLKQAADRGTRVHRAIEIESDNELQDEKEKSCYRKWKVLEAKHSILVKEKEFMVYSEEYDYAGTGDGIGTIGAEAIWDYKTTSALDKEYVGYQLGLLMLARKIERLKGYAVHIHHRNGGKLVEVDIPPKEELERIITWFKNLQSQEF